MHTDTAPADIAGVPGTEASLARQSRWPRFAKKNACGLVFVLFSLVFGCSFAAITPPLWGLDESTHFSRAYVIGHGQILPKQIAHSTSVNFGGEAPRSFVELNSYVSSDINDPPTFPAKHVEDPQRYEDLASQPLRAPLEEVGFANTSSYSPVSYVPSVLGLRAAEVVDGSLGLAISLMRLCHVLAYTAIVHLALWSLREHRFKWVVFVVALLPMAVFEASVITADTVTNALAILFSALFVKSAFLRERLSGPETWILLATVILLPLAKPTYMLLTLLLPMIPSARLAFGRTATSLVMFTGIAGFAAWTALSAQTSAAMHLMRPGLVVAPGLQVHYLLTHFTEIPGIVVRTFVGQENRIVNEIFGVFGWTWVQAPATAMIACLIAGALACGLTERLRSTWPQLVMTASVAVGSIAAIFATLYLEWTRVGHLLVEGVQGRYLIPLLVVLAAVLLRLVPLRLALQNARAARGAGVGVAALMLYALATSVLKYEFIL